MSPLPIYSDSKTWKRLRTQISNDIISLETNVSAGIGWTIYQRYCDSAGDEFRARLPSHVPCSHNCLARLCLQAEMVSVQKLLEIKSCHDDTSTTTILEMLQYGVCRPSLTVPVVDVSDHQFVVL